MAAHAQEVYTGTLIQRMMDYVELIEQSQKILDEPTLCFCGEPVTTFCGRCDREICSACAVKINMETYCLGCAAFIQSPVVGNC